MSKNIIEQEIIPTRKLFYNNSFGIYGAVPVDSNNHPFKLNEYGNLTIRGKFQELTLEVPYKVKLEEVNDKKYGIGYQIHEIYREVPKTAEAKKNFLYSILTDLQVDEIYKAFPDEDIIELFRSNTLDYTKVKGIGQIVYERLRQKVLENIDWQDLFSELGRYGIKFEMMKQLMDLYGTSENVIQKVKENPYVLTLIHGIGFKKADIIARNMGIKDDSPFRIQAAIRHVIGEEESNGHTYIERKELINNAMELLVLSHELIEAEIENTEGLHIEDNKISLQKTYRTEYELAQMLVERQSSPYVIEFDIDAFLLEQEEILGITLSDKQKEFFKNVLTNNINFLIGAAGTGKSMLQKILINLIKKLKKSVHIISDSGNVPPTSDISSSNSLNNKIEDQNANYTYRLLAPTGRAAKVLSQYVDGEKASTIHKAIGYGRKSNDEIEARANIEEDIVVFDESGMIDVRLANAALKKIKNPNAKIIFIGDAAQIASIGAGNVLKDCIDSGIFSVTVLDKVFRQEEGGLLDIATKTRKGQKYIDNDFVGEKKFGKDTILRSVEQLHMEKGYKHYYDIFLKMFDPEDIMVLSYTKKGTLGTEIINKNIQERVNPYDESKKEIKYHENCTFRVGDYVMNTKNTYDTFDIEGNLVDVMNGDSGVVIDIVKEKDIQEFIEKDENKSEIGYEHMIGIYVKFDMGVVAIPFEMMGQLMHSWSLTKHKSQGGSCKAGIVIVDKAHKYNSNANLVYTGITRCKQYLVILCQADSLNYVLKKFENMSRKTFLRDMLIRLDRESKAMNDKVESMVTV